MKTFARIDQNSTVTDVVVVSEQDSENGAAFLNALLGGVWIETFQDESLRKNYAGIGYSYNAEKDAFIPQRPYPSWNLNESTCKWEPPVPTPETGSKYEWVWNEQLLTWVNISSNT